jgi:phosphatidylserine/phosphatidylglycerophosphate/cardiolipin synthase-like enzyme
MSVCRSLFVAGLFLAVWSASGATLPNKARTVARLELVKDVGAARAFVKGNEVRLFYAEAGGTGALVFRASWKRAPLEVWDYRYHAAILRFDQHPPRLPGPKSAWQEATVLGREQWARFGRIVRERLTPSTPGHGVYVQTLEADAVLYREPDGQVRDVAFDRKPATVVVERRLNAQEFTVAVARAVEAELRTAYPGKRSFLIVQSPESPPMGFVLLDLPLRRCVLLAGPHFGPDPGGGLQLDTSLRSLFSLTLESHGVAILKNPLSSVARLLNLTAQTVAGLVAPVLPAPRASAPRQLSPGMDLTAWEAHLDELTGTPRDRGSVRFLIDGENFFPVFARRVAAAQHDIRVHVCIFDRDDVAVDVADLLRQRSAQVQVQVLLDRMCTQAGGASPPATPMREGFVPPTSIGAYLERNSDVRVRPFLNPWFSADHTKLLLIDRRYAYLGGMNIGREYRFEWHDLMAEVEGPVVARFERDFGRAWAHAGPLGDLAYAETALFGKRYPAVCDPARAWPEVRRLYTRTAWRQIRRAELAAIARAENHVYLENPYLFDRQVLAALGRAAQRGVDVRVVLPADNDLAGGRSSNFVIANFLLRNGVHVFLYPGMTHVKALLVDGWACFGSANFNKLSLRLNQEVNLATSDPDTVTRLRRELFEVDFAKSHRLTEPLNVSWTDNLADTVLSQF